LLLLLLRREWRLQREREVLQLRRNAQRQDAALQQHQAMHCKQQARVGAFGVGCCSSGGAAS
jgi:hypothetical protein